MQWRYTPLAELAFAGHPTIGAAFVLAAIGRVPLNERHTDIVLEETVGPVPGADSIRKRCAKFHATECGAAAGGRACSTSKRTRSMAVMMSEGVFTLA